MLGCCEEIFASALIECSAPTLEELEIQETMIGRFDMLSEGALSYPHLPSWSSQFGQVEILRAKRTCFLTELKEFYLGAACADPIKVAIQESAPHLQPT